MKKTLLWSGLCLAVLVAVMSCIAGPSAQAQTPYVVCNNSTVTVKVHLGVDCGGGTFPLAPWPVAITPGTCYTWLIPPGCILIKVIVGNNSYPAGYCGPALPPNPPATVCITATNTVIN